MRTVAARALTAVAAVLALAACENTPAPSLGGGAAETPPIITQALAAPDRPETDVDRDAARRSAEVVAFTGAGPGDQVLDLGSLGGYMAWIFSGVVGPAGGVTVHNPPDWYNNFEQVPLSVGELTSLRANTVSAVTPFDRLFATGPASSYDLVFSGLVYHDVAYLNVDRTAMNQQIYTLLRPGGAYVVVDHQAAPGAGVRDVQSLHRIDPAVVRSEVEAAGFVFNGALDVLTNPDDDPTLSVFDPGLRGATSQFVYLFVKPTGG